MKRLLSSVHLPIIFLCLILLALFTANYQVDTWLLGWDNLVPELDIWLNLKRSIFAVWQEYQGLGLVGGMGHSTDLIRQLLILPFSLILPHSLIRYLWHFAMIALGTTGVFFGLKKHFKFPTWIILLSSLFYLLNFGSIQNFWAPYDAFSTFWGFFPWLIFSLWNYLDHPNASTLKKLAVINLLAIPSFYVQTVFIVYTLCLSLIFTSYLLTSSNTFKTKIKTSLKTLLLITTINSFWLLPFGYFLKTESYNPQQGIGNFMSTQETFMRNQAHGNIMDFLILKGYYYDFPGATDVLMAPWKIHFSNSYFLFAGYIISLFVLIGLIVSFFPTKLKNYKNLSVTFIFLLSAIALLSNTLPFSAINQLIRQFPFINQVFRSPFTKFVFPAVFSFTILSAFGLQAITEILQKLKYSLNNTRIFLFSSYTILLAIFIYPAFQGNYIYPSMRQTLPQDYLDLINYSKTLAPGGRIATLPQGSFWGWTHLRWGYNGSGFLWYGLNQPTLDRAFDVWNLKNESYYWDISQAIQTQDQNLFNQIFQKYSIQYLIFDDNVYFPDEKIYAKQALSTKNLLKQMDQIELLKSFGNISIYQTKHRTTPYLVNTIDNTFFNGIQGKPFTPNTSVTLSQPIYPTSIAQIVNYQAVPKKQSATNSYRLTTKNGHNLLSFNFPQIDFTKTYLLKIESKNISGHPLTISAFDDNSRFKFFFYKLPDSVDPAISYFLIPKMDSQPYSFGLTIQINNPSFNQGSSINEVKGLTIYEYPVDSATTILPNQHYLPSNSNIFYYKTTLPASSIYDQQPNFLVLPQSYSSGWVAFYFDGLKPVFLPGHTTANSWANGWSLSPLTTDHLSPVTIYILFWPQLLQFLGFGLLISTFVWLFRKNH